MAAPLSDQELATWAREHLHYEVGMLMHTSEQLWRRQAEPRDRESNALLESFVLHVRCLSDFLWRSRGQHEQDAFAEDFCAEGVWERERPALPPALTEAAERNRAGQEVAHLTYHRLNVPAAEKDWQVGQLTLEIADAIDLFTQHAQPERLDDRTRSLLEQLAGPEPIGMSAIRTEARSSTHTEYTYRGGTIPLSDFETGS
jgi:hypothetical protein